MPILAVLAANLAACGDEKMTSKETTSSGNETTSSADDSSPFENDDLPDNLNFGDRFGLTFGDTNKYLGFQMALGGVTALKARYSADDDMTALFDLIREMIKIDVPSYFGSIVGSMVDPIKNLIAAQSEGQWSSEIAGKMGNRKTKFAEIWGLFS